MKTKLRYLLLTTIVLTLIGTLPSSSALAGSHPEDSFQGAGPAMLNHIKNNPCANGSLHQGDINIVACSGYANAPSLITVPLSYWETVPDYPLVNYPFYIGIGTEIANIPGTNTPYYFPRGNTTYPQLIDIVGLRTEIKLRPVKPASINNWNYNGLFELGENMTYWPGSDFRNNYGDDVGEELKKNWNPPKPTSATRTGTYYDDGKDGSVDHVVLRGFSTMSSYHAPNPAVYRGEPAYRLELASYYTVEARVSYQNYRLWEYRLVGTSTECKPGPNHLGDFDCIAPGRQLGHTVEIKHYEWTWGPYQGEGEGEWVPVKSGGDPWLIRVNSVRAPNGSINDHIPIVVYQSQPLLQEP